MLVFFIDNLNLCVDRFFYFFRIMKIYNLLYEIKYDHIHCHGNYIEVNKFNVSISK